MDAGIGYTNGTHGSEDNEKGMRFCAVLDSDRDVYYDAAPKPRMGRYPAACVSRAWISAVLLLNKPTSQGI